MKFINKETGTLLTEEEAMEEWLFEYDGNDPTNSIEFYDIYQHYSDWLLQHS